ncbi:MAG: hypothetical protein KDM81_01290, partial [Verrucomicrobiae bacterium]|nr:hypothetical protein [Verrucomicrobiae bacterium]
QLALGFIMYAGDFEDKIITSVNNYAGGFWRGPQRNGAFHAPAAGMSREEAMVEVEDGIEASEIYTYVPAVGSYHCPGDLRTKRLKPGSGWAWDSYSKANGMNGLNWQAAQPPYTKMSSVAAPSEAMIFIEESDPRGYNNGTWVINVNPSPGWVDPFAIFHGHVSTIGMADGHAELHAWGDENTIQAATQAAQGIVDMSTTFYWKGGNASNPDFRWVYQRYKHVKWAPL